MPDNPPPTSQATNDQLAALFLRDRDTPCPSCNYNRRDGTISTCPECGDQLQLIAVDQTGQSREQTIIKALMLLLLIFVIIELIQNSLTLARWLYFAIGMGLIALPAGYLIAQTLIVIAWLALLIFVIRTRRSLRNRTLITTKQFVIPIVLFLSMHFLAKIGLTFLSFF